MTKKELDEKYEAIYDELHAGLSNKLNELHVPVRVFDVIEVVLRRIDNAVQGISVFNEPFRTILLQHVIKVVTTAQNNNEEYAKFCEPHN